MYGEYWCWSKGYCEDNKLTLIETCFFHQAEAVVGAIPKYEPISGTCLIIINFPVETFPLKSW